METNSHEQESSTDEWLVPAPTRTCGDCDPYPEFRYISLLKDKNCSGCKFMSRIFSKYAHLIGRDTQFKAMDGFTLKVALINPKRNDYTTRYIEICEIFRPSDCSRYMADFQWDLKYGATDISGDTGSDQAAQWVSQHLDKCESSTHPRCKMPAETTLPTRLLEIVGPETVRLLVPPSDSKGRYVCLSHCWGRRLPVKTTKSTIEKYQENIPWSTLPKTFQEAVSFTYRLNLRLLWIDALCIMQDDLEDWRNEGGKMVDIYQQSYLTLSAMISGDSSGGCYARSSVAHLSQPLVCEDTHGNMCTPRIRQPLPHTFYEPNKGSSLPLAKRGWVLQESILSPRVLHFLHQELVWECNEYEACECSGTGTSVFNYRQMLPYNLTSLSKEDSMFRWHRVVIEYTKRSLTYEKDIFPALQGLAKYYHHQRNPGAYLAGLWEDTLIHDLLWKNASFSLLAGNEDPQRLRQWRAPSWSWAASRGQIVYSTDLGDDHARTMPCTTATATTVPVGGDPFGELRSGILTIQGQYLDAAISWRFDGDYVPTFKLHFKDTSGEDSEIIDWFEYYPDFAIWADGPDALRHNDMVRIVKLVESRPGKCCGLVLRRKSTGEDLYERVGLMCYCDMGSPFSPKAEWSEGKIIIV